MIAQSLRNRMGSAFERRLGVFAASVAFAWALAAGPAYLIAGSSGLVGSAVAAALCLVPGLVVLAAAKRLRGPKATAILTVASSMLRLIFVLGGGSVLYFSLELFTFHSLLVWLLVFHLLTLAFETGLLLCSDGT